MAEINKLTDTKLKNIYAKIYGKESMIADGRGLSILFDINKLYKPLY